MKCQTVGIVKSKFADCDDPIKMRNERSTIIVREEYEEGLYRIEEHRYLQVLFYLHESSDFRLKGRRRPGRVKGVFASRSPNRPTPIGLTTVELLERRENVLFVKGLDAIDGTPVVDIKPFVSSVDCPEQ